MTLVGLKVLSFVAGDDALVHSRLDVACRPRRSLRLILKRQVCRFYIARIGLVQPSEDNRRLLTVTYPSGFILPLPVPLM